MITFLFWRDQVISFIIVIAYIAYMACVFPNVALVMLVLSDCKFGNLKQWHINETTNCFSWFGFCWLPKQKKFNGMDRLP